jgi:hypothetical protein
MQPDVSPFTAADIAAIIAAPGVPMIANMNPFFEARLQQFAEVESGSRQTKEGRQGAPKDAGNWTWELARLFGQTFKQENEEPFVRFYREASRRLINSEYARDKDVDLSYLLFDMNQGNPEELSDDTILDTLRQQNRK